MSVPSESDPTDVASPRQAQPRARRKLVLLFDDNPDEARWLTQALESCGFRLRVAVDPGSVSGGALRFQPGAIVVSNRARHYIDDTLAALKRLKQSDRLSCPAIFIGDAGDLNLRLAAMRAGCSTFLDRELGPGALIEALDGLTLDPGSVPLRVLIIDDSRVTAGLHARMLDQAGIQTAVVNDPLAFAGPLKLFDPELILMDLEMPECTGWELAAVIRQDPALDTIPIVYLSGEEDRTRQLAALGFGGDDFLVKPIKAAHLVTSVKLRASRFRRLRLSASHDSLTGLPGHGALMARIARTLIEQSAPCDHANLAIFDIDRLWQINASHGETAGDQVIKSLAELLKHRLPEPALLGRTGGGEFTALVPGAEPARVDDMLDDIRGAFADIAQGAGRFTANFTVGVAPMWHDRNRHAAESAARIALLCAKQAGRNRVGWADA